MTAPGPASSGIADLDRTLGGLFWGDNVVWQVRRQASADPFIRALVAVGTRAEAFVHIAFGGGPAYLGIDVIDASAGGPNARPGKLRRGSRAPCAASAPAATSARASWPSSQASRRVPSRTPSGASRASRSTRCSTSRHGSA